MRQAGHARSFTIQSASAPLTCPLFGETDHAFFWRSGVTYTDDSLNAPYASLQDFFWTEGRSPNVQLTAISPVTQTSTDVILLFLTRFTVCPMPVKRISGLHSLAANLCGFFGGHAPTLLTAILR